MEFNRTKISEVIKQEVENLGFFFIDITFKGDSNNRIVEVYIDNRSGITTDICADVSGACVELIDSEELITSKYRIDISSPGIDRPIKYLPQFNKHIGRFFELEFANQPAEKFEGKLLKIDDDVLTFNIDKKEEKINFNNIESAKVIVRF